MIITTKDIKVKDQAPEKLTILQTGDIEPKKFAIKGKGKPKIEQTITTSTVKDKSMPLSEDQKKTRDDIKKEQARVKTEQKKTKKLEAELKKANAKIKVLSAKEKKIVAEQKKKKADKKKEA